MGRHGSWLPRGSQLPWHSLHPIISSPRCPTNERRREALSLFKIGGPFLLLLSCLSLSRILILILVLLTNGNVHHNLGPVFLWLVCAGNVTWRGRSVPEGPNFSTLSRSILETLSVSRNPTSTRLPLFGSLHLIALTPGLTFSPDEPHASGGVIIFSRPGQSFSELSICFRSSLDRYCDYAGVNISLKKLFLALFP